AGPADFKIGFGHVEAAGFLFHDAYALAGFLRYAGPHHEHAEAFPSAAAHASSELVKLREAESFGMFDEHHVCVGDINTHFDHRGRNQNIHFVLTKAIHDLVFFIGTHSSVKKRETNFGV